MSLQDEFGSLLLPGNYALTKSMELTKVNTSGTLWYIKKFLTLYYFVFLSKDILTLEYKDKVISIFDTFINSLDPSVKEDAEVFFYPDNDAINFKSEHFNYFVNFAGETEHANQEDRNNYFQRAKKYYFSVLMGSGGQTGIKKKLKESVQLPGFVYSHNNIDDIITDSAISGCIEDLNTYNTIRDNSIKYIISPEALYKLQQISAKRAVNRHDVQKAIKENPHDNPKYRAIENDMVAFIRNERQVLYYYGYFHSKSSGASDFEFSSLTPVGEAALYANFYEFLAIWEHQKIKMISQPITVDINYLEGIPVDGDGFGVSYTPYTDIIGSLIRKRSFSLEEYQYILSRKKSQIDLDLWEKEENTLYDKLEEYKNRVNDFGRMRDIKDEDARKELLKYLLGIRDDLPIDRETNPIGSVRMTNSIVQLDNSKKLELLYSIYTSLDKYKLIRYKTVIQESEENLKERYKAGLAGSNIPFDRKIKINWDLYNIHIDKFIILGTIFAMLSAKLSHSDLISLSKSEQAELGQLALDLFPMLLRRIGIRSHASVKRELYNFILAIKNQDYSNYFELDEKDNGQILAEYKRDNAADIWERINNISMQTDELQEDRIRNTQLVKLLKSYYMALYSNENYLTCECCGNRTFITATGEPYVEFHHLIPFKIAYGPDHYLNLVALCPNCHRKIHLLKVCDKQQEYDNININNYSKISFVERLMKLKGLNLLKSYHLEFLLADNAITQQEYDFVAA